MKIENKKIRTNDCYELDIEIRKPTISYKKVIIMCHGLTSKKEGRKGQLTKIADTLCENGYKVIQFDWRGHGKSSGIDLDVCPSSFYKDLTSIIEEYAKNEELYLFGFSFGGFAVNQYLYLMKDVNIKKIVLIGPALDPINSSLLNQKTFCYEETNKAIESGNLEKDGYVLWKSKNWRVSKKFIDECYAYNYKEAIKFLSNRTLILQGIQDKNVDKEFNERFSKNYNIEYMEFNASHSLSEIIDDVIPHIVNYYNK